MMDVFDDALMREILLDLGDVFVRVIQLVPETHADARRDLCSFAVLMLIDHVEAILEEQWHP